MSLKAFHLFFISLAILFCFGFGVWCLTNALPVWGVVTLLVAVALVIYELRFLKRLKNVSSS